MIWVLITCREPNVKSNYDRSSEGAKVNIFTQNVDTQQKVCGKGKGAKINIIKLGLTFFLNAGNTGPRNLVPKGEWALKGFSDDESGL